MLTLLKVRHNRRQSADSAVLLGFHFETQVKKITAAAKSRFPSCIVTLLLLSAGIKIISSKILTFTNVNMFRIPLGSTSQNMLLFFFFLKLHIPKGRNSPL